MPNFTKQQVLSARYWYEKIPYTYFTSSLATGSTPLYVVTDIAKTDSVAKMAILQNLSTSATTSENLSIIATHGSSRDNILPYTFPTFPQPVLSGEDEGMKSIHRAELSLVNNTGAAIDNLQMNYSVAIKRLNIAEKIFYGIGLTQEEQDLAGKLHLSVGGGMRPLAISEFLKRAFWGHVLDTKTYTLAVSSSDGPILSLTPGRDELFVVTSIASNATVGNQVLLTMNRDQDLNYVQVLADNMDLDHPLDMWMPFTSRMDLSISAQTQTSNVPVRLTVQIIQKSVVIRTLLGEISLGNLSGEDLNLYNQVRTGVAV